MVVCQSWVVYISEVCSVLLYGSETLTLLVEYVKKTIGA